MSSLIFKKIKISKKYFYKHRLFYPSGEPISLHRLRCSPFAVVYYSFMGHFLVVTAISTRK
jgi:hypothetical protein